jgi:hypothetical protein
MMIMVMMMMMMMIMTTMIMMVMIITRADLDAIVGHSCGRGHLKSVMEHCLVL